MMILIVIILGIIALALYGIGSELEGIKEAIRR